MKKQGHNGKYFYFWCLFLQIKTWTKWGNLNSEFRLGPNTAHHPKNAINTVNIVVAALWCGDVFFFPQPEPRSNSGLMGRKMKLTVGLRRKTAGGYKTPDWGGGLLLSKTTTLTVLPKQQRMVRKVKLRISDKTWIHLFICPQTNFIKHFCMSTCVEMIYSTIPTAIIFTYNLIKILRIFCCYVTKLEKKIKRSE